MAKKKAARGGTRLRSNVQMRDIRKIEDIVSEAKAQSSERVEAIVAEAKEEGRLAGEK